MKPLVIYHANCTDGFGAAFAAWLKLGDNAEYLPMDYLKATDGVAEFHKRVKRVKRVKIDCSISERAVYILDFSLPRVVMDWLFSHAKRVTWLDHHKTAFEMWCGGVPPVGYYDSRTTALENHYILLDNNKSGAMLAWEYFHPGTKVPMLIQHIDDRDRWQFKLEGSKEFHAALASYQPWTFEQWEAHFLVGNIRLNALKDEGRAILRAHNKNVQAALKQARQCVIIPAIIDSAASYKAPWVWGNSAELGDFCFASGLAANAPPFLASDLGHELANKSGTFGLVWSMAGDGQIHCSLRSNGDYDVSMIAKCFGGGGHRTAAGFSTDFDTLMSWLR